MKKFSPLRFKNLSVDMTAMCDVAFLLLCFFVLTAKFQQWEPMKIDTPLVSSTNACHLNNDSFAIIYVSDNRVMYQIMGDSVRKKTLEAMSKKYDVAFSADEKEDFLNAPIIGAPISQLKQYDQQYQEWERSVCRPGIPVDGNNNELFDWILESRKADLFTNGRALLIQIKADRGVKYPVIKQVIATLQKQQINRFDLLSIPEASPNYFQ